MFKQFSKKDFDKVFGIMERSFPESEHKTYEGQLAQMDEPGYRLYGLESEAGEITAFAAVREFARFVVLEHLAVDAKFRNGGQGGEIVTHLLAMYQTPICVEVELPEDEMAVKRIRFYERLGFYLNPYDYLLPHLTGGGEPTPMKIMTSGGYLTEEEFDEVRTRIYTDIYHL
ncbi:MAG: GNAT family N-acetyltransferase [Firmicutes bacterium]|nr:GNAT family N-acetyltransferase [Bacillota bacterium]